MSDFYGTWRTSRFRVKNLEKFKAWVATLPETNPIAYPDGTLSICTSGRDPLGTIPTFRPDIQEEFSLVDELIAHLKKGWSAAIFEVGNEKLRYLGGCAIVVSWDGKKKFVDINLDAERIAKKMGVKYIRYDS